MGVAAEHRASALISRQIDAMARPVEFVVMSELNELAKHDYAGTPFADVHFVASHGGWWAECPTTGFGFFYSTLREAVRSWRVEVYGYNNGIWIARPLPKEGRSL